MKHLLIVNVSDEKYASTPKESRANLVINTFVKDFDAEIAAAEADLSAKAEEVVE
jgi:hypothetical protein